MRPQVYEFIKMLNLHGKTLDIGSLDINGSVKDLFTDYIGLDMRIGRNVDIQANSNFLPFKDSVFDNVLCLETLEHDAQFWQTLVESKRVLKSNGTVAVTVPGIGFHKHEYPSDYWRFTEEGLRILLHGLKNVCVSEYEEISGVFGYGKKV